MQGLLVKLMIRGLMPSDAPWRTLIQYRTQSIQPKKGRKWPPNIHFILHATRVRGNGSDIWWAIWKACCQVRQGLVFQQPDGKEATGRQHIFWNKELLGTNNGMIGDSSYAYGCTWMKKHVSKIQDLWDSTTKD